MSINKREFTRVPLDFPVHVSQSYQVLRFAEGVDVSAGGIYVRDANPVPVGEECTVSIQLTESCVIHARAETVRHLEGGFAARFVEIDLESFEFLKLFVLYNADDQEKVEREFAEHNGLRIRQ